MSAVSDRAEDRQKKRIEEYITLLTIIHAEKPGQLMGQFQSILEPDSGYDDDVGDIGKLKSLKKNKRGV